MSKPDPASWIASDRGVNLKQQGVKTLEWTDGHPRLTTKEGTPEAYDLLAMATGVNVRALEFFEDSDLQY